MLNEGHILLNKGFISDAGYIELAAQTAGAVKGYRDKSAGRPIGGGYLAAVQNFTVHGRARRGDSLRITVTLLTELSGIRLIYAEVRLKAGYSSDSGELLASGRLKLFAPDEN